MKRKDDPRHKNRQKKVQLLFAHSFHTQDYPEISSIIKKLSKIDPLIKKCAPDWPLDQINKVDLAILRLATYELLDSSQPQKVIIDEAVELAKELGSDSSPKFVNGVLGSVVDLLKK